jgi:periplasmic copper chaperone A
MFPMNRMLLAAAACAPLVFAPLPASAQHGHGHQGPSSAAASARTGPTVRVGQLTITAPWTRATPQGARVAGGYMTIANTGAEPDRLIGGTFPLAGRLEVHEMAIAGGVMTMRELAQGLDIPAGGKVELRPGGFHVMFMDLREQVREGQPIKGTLVFQRAGTVEIEYRVAPIGARSGGHTH